ncbi:MAG: FAD-dependent oxidoreductase [Planctomycetes bacterium]|nr:FAD-dependent oxidoreductase [Planctomycetota bacterium]
MEDPGVTRRGFLAAGAALCAAAAGRGADPRASIAEPARDIPIAESADVVICGAGPAGVAAAIAAARMGCSTRLIEVHGCLGGIWTAGSLSWVIASRKEGILQEIIAALRARGAHSATDARDFAYDVEAMKIVLEEMAAGAGVRIRLHTRIVAASRDPSGRIRAVVTESKSGREAWTGGIFVDATGDGDAAALAGCGFDVGHPETGRVQPMGLMALLGGIRSGEVRDSIVHWRSRVPDPKAHLLREIERAGGAPSYARPSLFRIRDDLFALSANHEYGVSAFDAEAISGATLRARAELHRIIDGLRSLGGPWAGIRIVATAEQIGVREGRRIRGRYAVTREDLARGARHPDAITRVRFGVDIHSTDPAAGKGYGDGGIRSRPYDIPLRALIAKDAENLLLAGRCISGDFFAHASYRVTGEAVAMGQAAGVLAALAARRGSAPHEVPWEVFAPAWKASRAAGPIPEAP